MTRIPLVAAVCATLVSVGAWAQTAAPLKLPLDNLGLEHLDIVVPDTELQLFQPPAGLVTAAVKSPLPVEGDGLLTPRGVDHVMLNVSSFDKALPYYRTLYGTSAESPRDANGRIWYRLERGTRLGLQPAAAGRTMISHFAITVAPFDRQALAARLRELGADVLPSPDEPDVVRFLDNNRIAVEVRVAG
jgi:glyoxalase superfamily protein